MNQKMGGMYLDILSKGIIILIAGLHSPQDWNLIKSPIGSI